VNLFIIFRGIQKFLERFLDAILMIISNIQMIFLSLNRRKV